MKKSLWGLLIVTIVILTIITSTFTASANDPNTVKITPLGSHDGEFCARDRALILEDPNGTRILYDAGRTVAGGTDERLGKIDVVLLSHVQRSLLPKTASCFQIPKPICLSRLLMSLSTFL